jgi:hypothetical protein
VLARLDAARVLVLRRCWQDSAVTFRAAFAAKERVSALLTLAADGAAGDAARQAATDVASLLPAALLRYNHGGGPAA